MFVKIQQSTSRMDVRTWVAMAWLVHLDLLASFSWNGPWPHFVVNRPAATSRTLILLLEISHPKQAYVSVMAYAILIQCIVTRVII